MDPPDKEHNVGGDFDLDAALERLHNEAPPSNRRRKGERQTRRRSTGQDDGRDRGRDEGGRYGNRPRNDFSSRPPRQPRPARPEPEVDLEEFLNSENVNAVEQLREQLCIDNSLGVKMLRRDGWYRRLFTTPVQDLIREETQSTPSKPLEACLKGLRGQLEGKAAELLQLLQEEAIAKRKAVVSSDEAVRLEAERLELCQHFADEVEQLTGWYQRVMSQPIEETLRHMIFSENKWPDRALGGLRDQINRKIPALLRNLASGDQTPAKTE
jgi:hypothetical protein